jgi:hypothetical protein
MLDPIILDLEPISKSSKPQIKKEQLCILIVRKEKSKEKYK